MCTLWKMERVTVSSASSPSSAVAKLSSPHASYRSDGEEYRDNNQGSVAHTQ